MTVVACCGLATVDLVHYVDRQPGPDQKVQALAAALDFGGPAANAAATAASLGMRTRLITGLGDTGLARDIAGRITGSGIEVVDAAAGGDWQLPVSSVTVLADGRRSVVSTNAADAPAMALPDDALDGVDALLVDGHHLRLALAAARAARAAGVPVLLDGGSWKPGLAELIAVVDAAVLSADFRLPDGAAVESPIWGLRPVARTDAAQPITFRIGDATGEVVVPAVAVVDTLGAGDVFHGAWLAHVGEHGLADFAAGLGFAAGVASTSCSVRGVPRPDTDSGGPAAVRLSQPTDRE